MFHVMDNASFVDKYEFHEKHHLIHMLNALSAKLNFVELSL